MNTHFVKLKVEDKIGIISIDNHPHNSLTPSLMEEFLLILNSLEKTEVRAVIITGSFKCFSSGVDVNELKKINSKLEAEELTKKGQSLLNRLESFHVPVLAAINGVCLGGGVELALSCHIRYCGDKALFGFPELSIGIIPALGGTQRLPKTVGAGKAIELILTGNIISAKEAKEIGLVERIFPRKDLLTEVKKIAKGISHRNPNAVRFAIESVFLTNKKDLQRGLKKEAHLNSILLTSIFS